MSKRNLAMRPGSRKRRAEEDEQGGYLVKEMITEEEGEGGMSTKDNDEVKCKTSAAELDEDKEISDSYGCIENKESNSLQRADQRAELEEDLEKLNSLWGTEEEESSLLWYWGRGADLMSEDEGGQLEKEEYKEPEIKIWEYEPDDWFEDGIIYWGRVEPRPCDSFQRTSLPKGYQIKMMTALDYLNGISKLRTFFMYQRLKRDPGKDDIINLMYLVRCQEPCFELFQRQMSIMECYFRCDSDAKLYTNLTLVRHKDTGELVQVGKHFDHYRHSVGPHDEETDEQLVNLHETLQIYMGEIEGASFLKRAVRRQTFDEIAMSTSRSPPFDKVATGALLECISEHICFKVSMVLAEERKRAKIFIWQQRSRSKADASNLYDNKEALKFVHRLKIIDKNLFFLEECGGKLVECRVKPPSEEDSWASLSLEEQSKDEKWMAKIEEEHEQILHYVRGRMEIEQAVKYIKLKMEVAKELGIWKVPVDEYLQEIPEFFKRETRDWWLPFCKRTDDDSDSDYSGYDSI